MASPKVRERVASSYDDYLRLNELLTLQRPLAQPPAHDEMLFIVVHQVYELWFRLLLHELTTARDAMFAGHVHRPRLLLERSRVIERQMISQFDLLDTLSPLGFLEFRSTLAGTSGFESAQFREIEMISGWSDARYLAELNGLYPDGELGLLERAGQASLWDGYLSLLTTAGFTVDQPASRADALFMVSTDPQHRDLWLLAEGLLDHDQGWTLWRGRHALMVERQIGAKIGTGGSPGVTYLRSREHHHFFPELWEVRGRL
jgi:tryptophan 2,3-dioxygenase